jgi:hypothetical protein
MSATSSSSVLEAMWAEDDDQEQQPQFSEDEDEKVLLPTPAPILPLPLAQPLAQPLVQSLSTIPPISDQRISGVLYFYPTRLQTRPDVYSGFIIPDTDRPEKIYFEQQATSRKFRHFEEVSFRRQQIKSGQPNFRYVATDVMRLSSKAEIAAHLANYSTSTSSNKIAGAPNRKRTRTTS